MTLVQATDRMSILLLRHATAGHRSGWKGDDELRPLDKRGRRQADLLVESLYAYAATRIVSSPARRCVQTVEPLAARLELAIEQRDELSEGRESTAVRALLGELREETAVVCTYGDVILDLVGWERVAKKVYVRAKGYDSPSFDAALAKVRAIPSWSTFELTCGHDIMVDMPEQLAEILLASA